MSKWDTFLKRQIRFAEKHFSFKDCRYYPCHKLPGDGFLDCLFCYCPFYPCRNKVGTGKWIKNKSNKRIWDCSGCNFIHRSDVCRRIMELLYENKKFKQIKKIIRKDFCR